MWDATQTFKLFAEDMPSLLFSSSTFVNLVSLWQYTAEPIRFDHDKACKWIVDATNEQLGFVYVYVYSSSHANVDPPYMLSTMFKICRHAVRSIDDAQSTSIYYIAKTSFSRLVQLRALLSKQKAAEHLHLLSYWSAIVSCGLSKHGFVAETNRGLRGCYCVLLQYSLEASVRRARISDLGSTSYVR